MAEEKGSSETRRRRLADDKDQPKGKSAGDEAAESDARYVDSIAVHELWTSLGRREIAGLTAAEKVENLREDPVWMDLTDPDRSQRNFIENVTGRSTEGLNEDQLRDLVREEQRRFDRAYLEQHDNIEDPVVRAGLSDYARDVLDDPGAKPFADRADLMGPSVLPRGTGAASPGSQDPGAQGGGVPGMGYDQGGRSRLDTSWGSSGRPIGDTSQGGGAGSGDSGGYGSGDGDGRGHGGYTPSADSVNTWGDGWATPGHSADGGDASPNAGGSEPGDGGGGAGGGGQGDEKDSQYWREREEIYRERAEEAEARADRAVDGSVAQQQAQEYAEKARQAEEYARQQREEAEKREKEEQEQAAAAEEEDDDEEEEEEEEEPAATTEYTPAPDSDTRPPSQEDLDAAFDRMVARQGWNDRVHVAPREYDLEAAKAHAERGRDMLGQPAGPDGEGGTPATPANGGFAPPDPGNIDPTDDTPGHHTGEADKGAEDPMSGQHPPSGPINMPDAGGEEDEEVSSVYDRMRDTLIAPQENLLDDVRVRLPGSSPALPTHGYALGPEASGGGGGGSGTNSQPEATMPAESTGVEYSAVEILPAEPDASGETAAALDRAAGLDLTALLPSRDIDTARIRAPEAETTDTSSSGGARDPVPGTPQFQPQPEPEPEPDPGPVTAPQPATLATPSNPLADVQLLDIGAVDDGPSLAGGLRGRGPSGDTIPDMPDDEPEHAPGG